MICLYLAALAIIALYLACLAVLLWTAHRAPTEPTYVVQRERAAMRQEVIDQLVEDWGREIEFSLDDVVREWAS